MSFLLILAALVVAWPVGYFICGPLVWRLRHREQAGRLPKQQKPRTDVPGLRHGGEELDPWERAELMEIELGYRRTAGEPQYRDRSGS